MNISARCAYACHAVAELAQPKHLESPLSASAISGARDIPETYLMHILLQLKKAGVVRSLRGAHGGYQLARPPEDITLREVVEIIDGEILADVPEVTEDASLAATWKRVAEDTRALLDQHTFRDIVERAGDNVMYYI